jgi:TRAP-type C4-dicarboxylate transport system permease small subunit
METQKKTWLMGLLKNFDFFFAGIALSILVAVTFGGVPMRYALNMPLIWQQEIQLACAVWIVFWGAGGAFRRGGHIAIEILVDLLPVYAQKTIRIAGWFVSASILAYLFLQSCILIRQLHVSGRVTDILRIPFAYIYAVIPVGCITMAANSGYILVKELRTDIPAAQGVRPS